MKNLKKLISVVLCVAMVASFLVVGTSAASYPDVEETASYSAAVELLSALDILKGDENGNFNPDAEIKRSEFAAVICRAFGMESAATSSVSKFDDVAADHWAVGYIGWAAGKGIVNGYGDGTFAPDKAVSYQEAVKMIMASLGYGKLAENKGGYPYGYLSLAGTYGVTAGLSANPTEAAPRSLVAELVYNALEAPLMDTSYYSTTEERYVVYDGSKAADYEERTILSQYLDIIKVKANVANNYKTKASLWKKNAAPAVELDFKKVYNKSDADDYVDSLYNINAVTGAKTLKTGVKVFEGVTYASDFLACDVDAYLFFNEDEALELKAVVSDGKSIETLEVTKDIVTATTAGASASFTYWEDIDADSQVTEVDIKDGATVYLNGALVGVIGATETTPNTNAETEFAALAGGAASVTFIGARGEDFDKIFIVDYQYAQVEEVNVEDKYIAFDGGSIELDKEARNNPAFVYAIYKDGEEIALEDVKEGDVLSIVAPGRDLDNGAYIDIYVSSETLTGMVTGAKSTAATNRTYDIDGTEYTTVAANLLSVGDAGTFYLTADGKIYAVEATSTLSNNYGFVLKAGFTQSFGEKTWQMRIFTKEGTTATYTVAPTLKVSEWNASTHKYDETPYKRANLGQDTIMTRFEGYTNPAATAAAAYTAAKERLITYTLDGDMITKITVAYDSVANADLKKAYSVEGFTSESYKPATEKFAGYLYTDATKLFYAPIEEIPAGQTNAGKFIVNEDKVALLTSASLDEEESYDGYLYAKNADKEFGAAVITSDLGFAGKASALAVVISKAEGLDNNGEKAETVTVLRGGEVATYAVNDNADFASLSSLVAGDIIQFVLNGVDEIVAAELVYDIDETSGVVTNGLGSLTTYATTESTGEVQFVYGIVSDLASKYITLSSNHAAENTYVDFTVDYEDGCTLAKVDASKINTSPTSAIDAASSVSSFRATRVQKNASGVITGYPAQYVMVARVVDDEIVDAVAYQIVDANEDGSELNSETYKLTIA